MEIIEDILEVLPLILPIFIIDLGFKIYAVVDIYKPEREVKWNNKLIWVIISVIVSYGWVFYFLFGRDE